MSKSLLVEYMPFQPIGPISEQAGAKFGIPGGLVVQGILQRAGAKNQNGRIYPKSVLAREAKKYQKEYVDQNRALGELDHPESSVVNLNNVSHNVLKMWWDGDDLKGAVQILETPAGKILKSLFDAGITLGISSRGLGSVKELYKESAVEVQEDFELICFDFVSNPSTHGAFLRPMNESVSKNKIKNYKNVNNIITSILCDSGKCRILP
jgi:hypothetical protein|tara:strand:- start:122 stop:748 length:627 start_codon:yes stop_codon:yes gene_type:complete